MAFKHPENGSEGKPCTQINIPGSRTGSSSFSSTPDDQSSCLLESDIEGSYPGSSVEDLNDLNCSLRDSEYFRDLQESRGEQNLSELVTPADKAQLGPGPLRCPENHCGSDRENLSPTSNANMDLSDNDTDACVDNSDMDSFPILVRSMSTSRRHSWDFPLSPLDLGRRFSLDTRSIDSDVERDDQSHSHSSAEEFTTTDNTTSQTHTPERTLYSRSDILASDEKSRAEKVSRILETSKQAAGEEHDSDEGQSHIAKRRTSNAERKDSGNVTWYEFLSNENEEEEDRAERTEKGTKVKRTLSSLRNRMTGSFNKDKGKNREKAREREREEREKARERARELKEGSRMLRISCNGHQLVRGSFSSRATCSLCGKSLQRKHGLQCVNCAVNVHKSCKVLLPECSNSKSKARDLVQKSSAGAQSNHQASREQCLPADGSVRHASGMTVPPRGVCGQQSASSSNHTLANTSSSSSITGDMDEVDAFRLKRHVDDAISIAPSTTESIVEDPYYGVVRAELDTMAQDFEVESWSLAVDQQFLKKHSKEMIKRQDVIYELIQTEMHHVRTLKIMLRVYVRELRETLQLDEQRLDCLFPCLDSLLVLHGQFLARLRDRRQGAIEPGSERNYAIHRLADILIEQFSGDLGESMKESYGVFCSRHNEAVNYYKEQLQNNKKFHNLIRKINSLPIVRRLGVPECILLVTQRITKYPVLLERLLQYTEAGTEEHEELASALNLIKGVLVHVDAQVSLYQKVVRLRDIVSKMEPKAFGKIKDGQIFRREDVMQGKRKLLHEGMVNWKAASGRLKDILAVLLTDVLLLLQEKDQRYVFSAVDGKPSVISLQKLIVREVAHEEKAMFLICASSDEPEMYEIHTASKDERNTWITHIRQAVESCPQTEEQLSSEEEGARHQRYKDIQDRLAMRDHQIMQALTEKLQIFAELALAECAGGLEDTGTRPRLLLRGDASDLLQGEHLLKGAITEVENLQNLLLCGARVSPQTEDGLNWGSLPKRAGTFGGYDSAVTLLQKNGSVKKHLSGAERKSRERSQRASSDPQLKEVCASQGLQEASQDDPSIPIWSKIWSNPRFPETDFYDRVLLLSRNLYSLQAIISQQDSMIELQRTSLGSAERQRGTDVLLEQEKQRNLEKQREEMAQFQRVQAQQQQEQERWERERNRQRKLNEAEAQRLQEREDECRRLEERLALDREELQVQKQKYQQDLERLRESTRAVEKERERLELQRKMKKHNTAPSAAAVYGQDTAQLPPSSSFNGEILSNSGGDTVLQPRSQVRPGLSVSPSDYAERPEVPPRRESGAAMTIKTEVPIHLVSTTNQLHKQGGVQQQIPTKLALQKSKDKSGKSKASQRTDSSASVDAKQMLSLKLSESSLKARRSISPHQQPPAPQPPITDPSNMADRFPAEPLRAQNQSGTPPYAASDEKEKEDVIFF